MDNLPIDYLILITIEMMTIIWTAVLIYLFLIGIPIYLFLRFGRRIYQPGNPGCLLPFVKPAADSAASDWQLVDGLPHVTASFHLASFSAPKPSTRTLTSAPRLNNSSVMAENFKSYFSGAAQGAANFAKEHPYAAAGMGTGVAICAAPVIVAGPALAFAGFGANGVVGGQLPTTSQEAEYTNISLSPGSIAAGAQSSIGSVVAPSLFATLQSAGAGGYGVSAVYGAVQGAAALFAAGSGGAAYKSRKSGEKGESEKSKDEHEPGEPGEAHPDQDAKQTEEKSEEDGDEDRGENGVQTTAIKAVLGAGAFVCPALWSAPLHGVTSLIGFGNTIAGVQSLITFTILGSLAAAWQSSIGNVAALSPFAILQSFGPGGYGTAVINGVVQGAGAALGGEGICALVSEWAKGDDDQDGVHDSSPDQEPQLGHDRS
ncbi:Lactose regulatory [Fusarium albosuccineum]|uniref:Lactose regulatory n=1 Tax=Fusarium albosuccineum TaxID=1237068 RepID=A0A8H4LCZ4_9HYPO|nr:Lactose regulatory [Fusarium albosuccineum]